MLMFGVAVVAQVRCLFESVFEAAWRDGCLEKFNGFPQTHSIHTVDGRNSFCTGMMIFVYMPTNDGFPWLPSGTTFRPSTVCRHSS